MLNNKIDTIKLESKIKLNVYHVKGNPIGLKYRVIIRESGLISSDGMFFTKEGVDNFINLAKKIIKNGTSVLQEMIEKMKANPELCNDIVNCKYARERDIMFEQNFYYAYTGGSEDLLIKRKAKCIRYFNNYDFLIAENHHKLTYTLESMHIAFNNNFKYYGLTKRILSIFIGKVYDNNCFITYNGVCKNLFSQIKAIFVPIRF